MKKLLITLITALAIVGCGIIKTVPVETNTQVNIKDSTVVHWIDSIRIHEATRYRDFSWIGDTLKLEGNRSRAWAVADTLKGCLIGEIEEDKVEEKTKIVFRDRWKVRDSLVYVEKPVPVDRVEYKTPTWSWYSLILNIIGFLVLGFLIYLRIKKT